MATAEVWIAPARVTTAAIADTSDPSPVGIRHASSVQPTPTVASSPAAHQAARRGVSEESMTASIARRINFLVEYFVSPAERACRSYQTGSCRKPVQATSERR